MRKGGTGGGSTITGLNFEGKADILTLLHNLPGYRVEKGKIGFDIYYQDLIVAHSYSKHDLYRYLESRGVDWKKVLSKKLLPDGAMYVIKDNTLYILEMKYQQGAGSVDEKLQTCDFKKKQYQKLMAQINIEVHYIYVLNDWFKHPRYKDSLDYVISVGCQYYFEYLPFHKIGLPVPAQP